MVDEQIGSPIDGPYLASARAAGAAEVDAAVAAAHRAFSRLGAPGSGRNGCQYSSVSVPVSLPASTTSWHRRPGMTAPFYCEIKNVSIPKHPFAAATV
jgi:hypothetical protein